MKALVIYDSIFGNTEKIALAVGEAAGARGGEGGCAPSCRSGGNWFAAGGLAHARLPPTEGIQKLLKGLPKGSLAGVAVGGFDTRADVEEVNNKFLTGMVKVFGYAAEPIQKALVEKRAAARCLPPTGFFITASEGPLREGELERAKEWGKQAVGKAG